MCGIAGVLRREPVGVDRELLLRMAGALQHRGPDGCGVYTGRQIGFAHTRLSIIDPAGGAQPMALPDGSVVLTYNGEIYNYRELRAELSARGHHFTTQSDTEVLLHAYVRWGEQMLERLNGQFAFALHDRRTGTVLLARDRFGVRPLFYAERNNSLYFASEAKAIFASGEVEAAVDPNGLDEIFTFWGARAPRTPFLGIVSLEPGCYATWQRGRLRIARYYAPRFAESAHEPAEALDQLEELLRSSVDFRMRADVPVGAYLSGGLDSSITAALAAQSTSRTLNTFSITYSDPRYDESGFQQLLGKQLGTNHFVRHIEPADIADVFPRVVWHAETPLTRTAPAPMMLLAELVREHGIKVVLTGEGADEMFLGYDLFKETVLRLFCMRQPTSRMRPRLFDRLYPLQAADRRGGDFWRRFFLEAGGVEDPLFSHLPRFNATTRIKDFYSADTRSALAGADPLAELRMALPEGYATWSPLNRAAHLERVTLLASYLLSSQGDRMAMAHGVEGRFPFLDHRLAEFAAALPSSSKLRGLREKDILRRWAARLLPPSIAARPKQAYRAPDTVPFFGPRRPDYVAELLAPDRIRDVGIFDPRAVAGLVRRCEMGRVTGTSESQAFVAILSTQLWYQAFCEGTSAASPAHALPPDVIATEPDLATV